MTAVQSDLVTVTIDDVEVQVPKGTLLVEAAKVIKREIPVYCYHTKLGPAGLCRICLVAIDGMPKLQIACNTQVADKMVVHTFGNNVEEGRRAVLELLLLNHPLDCPICDKGGECDLQDFAMAYGQGASRLADPKSSKPKAVDLGPTIVLDEERCILCLRCVRFDDVITGERSLRTEDRGAQAIIATATGHPYVSNFSGNVTELCPVGALTSKTYRFRSRPWDNHRTTTTCMQCSVGCALHVDQRNAAIVRTMSVEDDPVSDGWLCDRGRYNIGYVTDERRLTQPLYRQNDELVQIGWDDAIALWAGALREAVGRSPQSAGAIGGGRLLNEEAFLLQHVHRALGVHSLDWRAGRQVHASAPPGGTYADLEGAQAIVTFGRPPLELAPVFDLRLRKAVARNGATLFAVGDHVASRSVPVQRYASFAEAANAIPPAAERIALIWDGVPTPDAASVAAWAESARAAGKRISTFVLGEQPNARGAEAVGMLPTAGGFDTAAMLRAGRDGKLAVLALLGVNPVLHWPERELALAALRATPFVVVSELFLTETAELATLILPARAPFEKSGTTTDLCGSVRPVVAGVVAPEETLGDGDMLIALADALGVELPAPDEVERRVGELLAQPPQLPELVPPAQVSAGAGLRLVVESPILSGGGTLQFDARLGELRATPRAGFHPKTAAGLGIAAGDIVELGAGENALSDLVAVLDERLPEGAVAIVDGIPGAPANALGVAVTVDVRTGAKI